jgi:protein kinase C substrate 80K-H
LIEDANNQIKKWEEEKAIIEDEIVLKKSNILRLQDELKELEAQQDVGKKHKKKCPPCDAKSAELDILIDDVQLLMDELDTLQSILADMKRDHNHNYHDMAVKSAITGFDEFVERFEETKDAILTDVKEAKSKNEGFINQNNADAQDAEEGEEEEEEEEELSSEEKAMKEGKYTHKSTSILMREVIMLLFFFYSYFSIHRLLFYHLSTLLP